ncbi:hypothetical protein [Cardiobacterium sp. Marseille-Q4385]|uniref:hypothetical protein n=1 Tax=Cardiobacterium sp. Marseille-Q4385 TaxID=2866573 RepID=UPI001CE48849|nr:hypothetical protein [Cardiobacterium sp. Marseille-Q4385]
MNILQKLFPRRRSLDPATFTNHLAEAIRQAHPGAKIDVHTAKEAAGCHIHITFTDDTELTPSVINLWQVYQQQPAALNEIISQYVAGINETARMISGDDIPQAAQILPVIKNHSWLQESLAALGDDNRAAERHYNIPLVGDLALTFVVDNEHNMRFLTTDDSAALGLDDLRVLTQQAEENLAAYIDEHGYTSYTSQDGLLHRFVVDGVYDASLIFFLDPLLEQLPIRNAAVAVAARDALFICDADDPAALARLRAETDAVQDSPYTISTQLYRWQDGRLTPYPAP